MQKVGGCGFAAMGVTSGSMWNAPPSKRGNYQKFIFVKTSTVQIKNYFVVYYVTHNGTLTHNTILYKYVH